jgi:hypothetical protein
MYRFSSRRLIRLAGPLRWADTSSSRRTTGFRRHVNTEESLRLGVVSGWYSTKVSGTFVTDVEPEGNPRRDPARDRFPRAAVIG